MVDVTVFHFCSVWECKLHRPLVTLVICINLSLMLASLFCRLIVNTIVWMLLHESTANKMLRVVSQRLKPRTDKWSWSVSRLIHFLCLWGEGALTSGEHLWCSSLLLWLERSVWGGSNNCVRIRNWGSHLVQHAHWRNAEHSGRRDEWISDRLDNVPRVL
jgi:hypothetical protein